MPAHADVVLLAAIQIRDSARCKEPERVLFPASHVPCQPV
jgi:hypothetical protein